jgi:hypothetical protein
VGVVAAAVQQAAAVHQFNGSADTVPPARWAARLHPVLPLDRLLEAAEANTAAEALVLALQVVSEVQAAAATVLLQWQGACLTVRLRLHPYVQVATARAYQDEQSLTITAAPPSAAGNQATAAPAAMGIVVAVILVELWLLHHRHQAHLHMARGTHRRRG